QCFHATNLFLPRLESGATTPIADLRHWNRELCRIIPPVTLAVKGIKEAKARYWRRIYRGSSISMRRSTARFWSVCRAPEGHHTPSVRATELRPSPKCASGSLESAYPTDVVTWFHCEPESVATRIRAPMPSRLPPRLRR